MKTIALTLILILVLSFQGITQNLSSKQKRTIDSLTGHWNKEKSPGGAIAIIHKGEVLFQNSFGLANMDNDSKIEPQTSFQLAQLSDSFVAFALLQLHHQGKLSLEDNVGRYMPQLKNLSDKLQVKHLLQQSSGIHDFEILKNIMGWSESTKFSVEDAIALIARQESLSFTPGTEFAYSRSNILLASEIISTVSQMSFSDYMEKYVFKPLGMINSFVLSESNQNNAGVAKSYRVSEDGSINQIPSKKETYAGINISASIEDMVRWEKNLVAPTIKTRKTVAQFNSFVVLKNGASYSVPQGKLTYGQRYIHKERGLNTEMSTGGIDGFASAIFNFPSEDFSIITLSNNGEPYNGYIGMLSAHTILRDAFTEPTSIDFDALQTLSLDKVYHKKYEGHYWDALGELSRQIRIENDTLRYIRNNGNRTPLILLTKDRFQMKTDFDNKIYLNFSQNDISVKMYYVFGEATPIEFEKYTPVLVDEQELNSRYAGTYSCETLGVTYEFNTEGKKLKSTNGTSEPMSFSPVMKTIFSGDQWFMGSIEFKKDKDESILGFYVRNDAIRNLWFKKD